MSIPALCLYQILIQNLQRLLRMARETVVLARLKLLIVFVYLQCLFSVIYNLRRKSSEPDETGHQYYV